MRVLALETSSHVGSVALLEDGALRAELSGYVRARHGETLLPRVRQTLETAGWQPPDIDLVAVGLGPGSFTGVRIGMATAKGLCLSLGRPLVGVTSLHVLAKGMPGSAPCCVPIVDAYKGEVYAAAFERDAVGKLRMLAEPFHAPPEQAAERLWRALPSGAAIQAAGDGLRRYEPRLGSALKLEALPPAVFDVPRAACLALEAQLRYQSRGPDDAGALEPLYLRPSDAKLPDKPLRIG